MTSTDRTEEWNLAYRNKNNFVFYPHEEVIRFINKYVIKRTGYRDFLPFLDKRKMLDLGCGIGRHVFYGLENQIDSYGIDLSEEAINTAKNIAGELKVSNIDKRFIVGDIRQMPWADKEFNLVISHGVLDSMPFSIAREGLFELHRITCNETYFYCDLVTTEGRDVPVEEIIETEHEKGTIQSYFTEEKIESLIEGLFEIKEIIVVDRRNISLSKTDSRYHLVLKKL